jgi:beta-lactam-binding protein with PASTA domain
MGAPEVSAQAAQPAEAEEKKDRRKILWWLLFLALLAIGVLFFLSQFAEIPDVVGMSRDEAAETLEDAGFEMGDITEVQSAEVDPGEVDAQSPEAGRRLLKGTRVDLDVAAGAGGTSGDGDGDRDSSGYDNGGYDTGDDDDTDGDSGFAGSGGGSVGGPYVPSVQNTPEASALATLRSAGYRPYIGGYGPATAGVLEGYVYFQEPAPGTPLPLGSAIELWVSTGAPHEDGYEGVPYPGPTN